MRWLAFLFGLGVGFGPGPGAADLDRIATDLAAHPAIPGAFVGWTSAEAEAMAVAGLRRAGGEGAVAESDLWHVGSLTKSMTAVLAARLVEAGLIGWDTTAGEVLGSAYPEMDPVWRDVPLEAFLHHGSGMTANIGRLASIRLGQGPRADYVAQVLVGTAEGPRDGFLYSNAGYVVAGAMLEAVGGADWETLIAREVFGPLGLSSAGFGAPEGAQPVGHRAALLGGIRPVPPGPQADNIPALGPAGRVHLSGGDMLRYLRAHLVATELLSPESWAWLHEAQGPGDYAMGWVDVGGVLRHSGSNTLWFAQMRLYPEEGVAVFVAVNSGALGQIRDPVEAAAEAVLAHALRIVTDD